MTSKTKYAPLQINEERNVFKKNIRFDFFSETGLVEKTGFDGVLRPIVTAKELIDNALDACEEAGIAPRISVTLTTGALVVEDNGPGIPESTVHGSVDYDHRVSSKRFYVGPTRGLLGHALKATYAAVAVAMGTGQVVIDTPENKYLIACDREFLKDSPSLPVDIQPSTRAEGTSVAVYWEGIASLRTKYNGEGMSVEAAMPLLVADFSALNPHAMFQVTTENVSKTYEASNLDWKKWSTKSAGKAHWYTAAKLKELIDAFVDEEEYQNLTLRKFIGKFDGLAVSAVQTQVVKTAGLGEVTYLHELVINKHVDVDTVKRLLIAMQEHSKNLKPEYLGVVGRGHATKALELRGVKSETVRYKVESGTDGNSPYIFEAAFGEKAEGERNVIVGINHSPAIDMPYDVREFLDNHLATAEEKSTVLLLNIAFPRKVKREAVYFNGQREESLKKALQSVTAKKRGKMPGRVSQKDAALKVCAEAYMQASAGNTLPTMFRQIYYVARPLIEQLSGKLMDDGSFREVLKQFMMENRELTSSWDVLFDPRGHFAEPHTRSYFGMGTKQVREYFAKWDKESTGLDFSVSDLYPTHGPRNRFTHALFIEKEGFESILDAAGIAERYDLAVFSSKGQASVATKRLVNELVSRGVTILVVHDHDYAGFEILQNLKQSKEGAFYEFNASRGVIDLGLSLKDATAYGLESETYSIRGKMILGQGSKVTGPHARKPICCLVRTARSRRDGSDGALS